MTVMYVLSALNSLHHSSVIVGLIRAISKNNNSLYSTFLEINIRLEQKESPQP